MSSHVNYLMVRYGLLVNGPFLNQLQCVHVLVAGLDGIYNMGPCRANVRLLLVSESFGMVLSIQTRASHCCPELTP